jgi:glutamine amidotransferase/cyclase
LTGADKVSIGSDAVFAAEEYHRTGGRATGKTAIEAISKAYGCQAVVISGMCNTMPGAIAGNTQV